MDRDERDARNMETVLVYINQIFKEVKSCPVQAMLAGSRLGKNSLTLRKKLTLLAASLTAMESRDFLKEFPEYSDIWSRSVQKKKSNHCDSGVEYPNLDPTRFDSFSNKPLWRSQRMYYEQIKDKAWERNDIPFQISTNAMIATLYKDMITSMITRAFGTSHSTKKVAVVEVGAGHGKLSQVLARQFLQDSKYTTASAHTKQIDITVICTDFHDGAIAGQLKLPWILDLCQAGMLDFAVCDADDCSSEAFRQPSNYFDPGKDDSRIQNDDGLILMHAGRSTSSMSWDMVIIVANYAFDSFPADLIGIAASGRTFEIGFSHVSQPVVTRGTDDSSTPAQWPTAKQAIKERYCAREVCHRCWLPRKIDGSSTNRCSDAISDLADTTVGSAFSVGSQPLFSLCSSNGYSASQTCSCESMWSCDIDSNIDEPLKGSTEGTGCTREADSTDREGCTREADSTDREGCTREVDDGRFRRAEPGFHFVSTAGKRILERVRKAFSSGSSGSVDTAPGCVAMIVGDMFITPDNTMWEAEVLEYLDRMQGHEKCVSRVSRDVALSRVPDGSDLHEEDVIQADAVPIITTRERAGYQSPLSLGSVEASRRGSCGESSDRDDDDRDVGEEENEEKTHGLRNKIDVIELQQSNSIFSPSLSRCYSLRDFDPPLISPLPHVCAVPLSTYSIDKIFSEVFSHERSTCYSHEETLPSSAFQSCQRSCTALTLSSFGVACFSNRPDIIPLPPLHDDHAHIQTVGLRSSTKKQEEKRQFQHETVYPSPAPFPRFGPNDFCHLREFFQLLFCMARDERLRDNSSVSADAAVGDGTGLGDPTRFAGDLCIEESGTISPSGECRSDSAAIDFSSSTLTPIVSSLTPVDNGESVFRIEKKRKRDFVDDLMQSSTFNDWTDDAFESAAQNYCTEPRSLQRPSSKPSSPLCSCPPIANPQPVMKVGPTTHIVPLDVLIVFVEEIGCCDFPLFLDFRWHILKSLLHQTRLTQISPEGLTKKNCCLRTGIGARGTARPGPGAEDAFIEFVALESDRLNSHNSSCSKWIQKCCDVAMKCLRVHYCSSWREMQRSRHQVAQWLLALSSYGWRGQCMDSGGRWQYPLSQLLWLFSGHCMEALRTSMGACSQLRLVVEVVNCGTLSDFLGTSDCDAEMTDASDESFVMNFLSAQELLLCIQVLKYFKSKHTGILRAAIVREMLASWERLGSDWLSSFSTTTKEKDLNIMKKKLDKCLKNSFASLQRDGSIFMGEWMLKFLIAIMFRPKKSKREIISHSDEMEKGNAFTRSKSRKHLTDLTELKCDDLVSISEGHCLLIQGREKEFQDEIANLKETIVKLNEEKNVLEQKISAFEESTRDLEARLKSQAIPVEETPIEVLWECKTDTGWMRYGTTISAQLEERCQSKTEKQLSIQRDGIPYIADFDNMVQRRCDGKYTTERPIRRVSVQSTASIHLPWTSLPHEVNSEHGFAAYSISSGTINFAVTKETQEFNLASAHFCRLLDKNPSVVKKVEVIEYDATSIVKRNFEEKRQQFSSKGQTAEEWVFHGTAEEAIVSIVKSGFKVGGIEVPVKNGSSYGYGIYTATGPQTPMGYARGANKVVLARALVGTKKLTPHGDAESDSWVPNHDWIVFKDGPQLLPCYVVHFSV